MKYEKPFIILFIKTLFDEFVSLITYTRVQSLCTYVHCLLFITYIFTKLFHTSPDNIYIIDYFKFKTTINAPYLYYMKWQTNCV